MLLCLLLLAQWEQPVRLTHDDSSSHTSFNNVHCLAGAGSNLHLAFYDNRTGVEQVWYMRSTDKGTTWSAETALTSGVGMKTDPSIAVTGDTVHVAWEDRRHGYASEVYYRRSTDNGQTWDEEQRLTDDSYMSRNPCIAVSGANVYLAWASDTVGRELFFQRSTDGGATWVDRRRLTFDMQESWYPSLAAGGQMVHLAWRDWRDHNFEVWYLRSTDCGATWDTAAVRLSGDLATGSYNPCIAAADSGRDVHVIWWDCRHTPFELYYRRSTDAGATWDTEKRLTTDTTGTYNPSIAASGPNVHVAWEALYGTAFLMYKSSSDRGANWSIDTTLTVTPDYWSVAPCTAVVGAGVHVAWTDFRDNQWGEIYYMRDTTGNATAVEEAPGSRPEILGCRTIVRGVLMLGQRLAADSSRPELLDAAGRVVMSLVPGPNDVSRLAPGVYFVRDESVRATSKVIIQR